MSASPSKSGEPRLASFASWLVLVASFGLSASTWIALGVLAGFTATLSVVDVTLRLAWLMPVAVDGYVVTALVLWMAPVPAKVAAFARKNTYLAAGIGIIAQSAYHLLSTMSTNGQLWRVVMAAVVGALPPALSAGAVHMRSLVRRESDLRHAPGHSQLPESDTHAGHVAPAVAATPTRTFVPVPAIAVPTVVPTVDTSRPAPSLPLPAPSLSDDAGTAHTVPTEPAPAEQPVPQPATAVAVPPTPAELAARITQPRPASVPTASAAASDRAASTGPRTGTPSTTAPKLAPSATDTFVSELDAAQLSLPIVSPDVLTRADRVARQYRTEHGTPITAGQLAARLKVPSEQARQALAVLDLGPDSPTTPIPTVNGNRPKATR
jgi:hypothetical protein